jgi:kynurenine formamidase
MIDLSVLIENKNPSDPKEMIPRIEYFDHETCVPSMLEFFWNATKNDLPNGLAWAIVSLSLTSHSGTHLDAPYHYHPTMNKGQKAWTIDEVPLEWCYGDGVVLNFYDKANGYSVTIADVKEKLRRINYQLKPNDIVLIHTKCS